MVRYQGFRPETTPRRARLIGPLAILVTIFITSLVAFPRPTLAQGFFFGPGYGAGFGVRGSVLQDWRYGAWGGGPWGGGFGVAPSRIDVTIGVPPGFPHNIGVPPGYFIPPPFPYHGNFPFVGGFPDYRSQYTLRVLQSHQAQMEFAEALGMVSPLGVQPLHQDEVYRRFGADGSMGRDPHFLPQSPLDFSGDRDVSAAPVVPRDPDAAWPAVTKEGLNAISDQMVQAARRLDQSLARRGEEGDIWRQYLSTDLIAASNQQPLAEAEWIKVLRNFNGVVANSDLRWVMRSDGFAETRQWVSAWIDAKAAVGQNAAKVENNEPASPTRSVPPPPPPPRPNRNRTPDFEELPAPERARL